MSIIMKFSDNMSYKYESMPVFQTYGKNTFYAFISRNNYFYNAILRKSINYQYPKKPFLCSICHKGFYFRNSYVNHDCVNAARPFVIHLKDSDGVTSNAKQTINLTFDRFSCDFCKTGFSDASFFAKHLLLRCGDCKICFFTNEHLKQHIALHPKDKPFECKICKKLFLHRKDYSVHLRVHSDKVMFFPCEVCKRVFTQKSHLKDHMRLHTGEKPYKCNQCPKAYPQRTSLKNHLLTHLPEMPYKCDICNRTFSQKGNYKAHLSVHAGIKPFKCAFCPKAFLERRVLEGHLTLHVGKKPFRCDVCYKAFAMKKDMEDHRNIHYCKGFNPKSRFQALHNKGSNFKCNTCNKAFSDKSHLETHLLTHVPECDSSDANPADSLESRTVACSLCKDPFNSVESLFEHMRFSCHECKECFGMESAFNVHQRDVHNKNQDNPHVCSFCNRSYKRVADLNVHLKKHAVKKDMEDHRNMHYGKGFNPKSRFQAHLPLHNKGLNFKCDTCNRAFTDKSHLETHLLTHVPECNSSDANPADSLESGSVACGLCKDPFNSVESLFEHMRFTCHECKECFGMESPFNVHQRDVHNKNQDNPHVCSFCNRSYKRVADLNVHLKNHGVKGGKFFKCKLCPKSYESRHSLKQHVAVRHEGKPYKCNVCGKNFSENWYLGVHLRIHTGEKPFQCEVCEKTFISRRNMLRHMCYQPKDTRFACGVCEKTFSSKPHLKNHMKAYHSHESPFKCGICQRALSNKRSLEEHMKTHTKKKNFQCKVCDCIFLQRYLLKRHIKRNHPGVELCDVCFDVFTCETDLWQHMNDHVQENSSMDETCQSDQEPAVCDICHAIFLSINGLNAHRRVHFKSDPSDVVQEVSEAPLEALSETTLNATLNHRENEPIICDICQRTFSCMNGLNSHRHNHFKKELEESRPVLLNKIQETIKTPTETLRNDPSETFQEATDDQSENELFVCDICERVFSSMSRLNSHRHNHFKKELEESQPVLLGKIQETIKTPTETLRNDPCETFQETTDDQSENELFVCDICERVFSSMSRLNSHRHNHFKKELEESQPVLLDKIQETIKTPSETLYNDRSETFREATDDQSENELFVCDICERVFSSMSRLNSHRQNHFKKELEESQPVLLDKIQETIKTPSETLHNDPSETFQKATVEQSENEPFVCGICERVFSSMNGLNGHRRVHAIEKQVPPDLLQTTLKASETSQKATCNRRPNRSVACDICQRRFLSVNGLYSHRRVHFKEKSETPLSVLPDTTLETPAAEILCSDYSEENPIECEICLMKFSTEDALNSHQCIVDLEDPDSKKSLKRHKHRHSRPKRYECHICHETFGRKRTLENHVFVHNVVKPFRCDVCQKEFTQKVNLDLHRRMHTGERPFVCDACDLAFTRKHCLQVHMRKFCKKMHSDGKS